jgi:hypothetical protein
MDGGIMKNFFIIAVILLFCGVASAADRYVDTAGSNTSPYETEAKAATTLQAALAGSASGDVIKVVAGITTNETIAPTVTSGSRTIEKYGDGDNPNIVQSDVGLYALLGTGNSEFTVIGINFSGGRGVTITNNSGTLVQSFTNCSFTDSSGDGAKVDANAAGMYLVANFTDCVSYDNGADGYKLDSEPTSLVVGTYIRCVGYGHTESTITDGFSLHNFTEATLIDCEFYGNTNGVSNVGDTKCTMNGGYIHDNIVGLRSATDTGTSPAEYILNGVLFEDNTGNQIGSDFNTIGTTLNMQGCVISGTAFGEHGLVAWGDGSSFSIKNCTFSGTGGGVYVDTGSGADVTIENCVIDTTTNEVALYYVSSADIPDTTISYSVFNKSVSDASNEDITAISTNAGMQFEADIGFLSAGNFRLNHNSPCIGTGISNDLKYLHPLTNEFYNRFFIVSDILFNDIGAFIYAGNCGLR